MNPFFVLLLASLAVFRGAELVAVDNGPFHIFKWLRKAAAKRGPVIGELFSCQYCVGGHLAIWTTALLWWRGMIDPWLAPIWWLAIAGGAAAWLRAVRERV